MDSKIITVYRIASEDEGENVEINKIYCPSNKPSCVLSDEKKKLEDKLEEDRRKDFPNLPPRQTSVFVCHSLENVKMWLNYKYSHMSASYYLLKIEVENKNVCWFNAKYYNEYFAYKSIKMPYSKSLDEVSKSYWDSALSDILSSDLASDEYEGLIFGSYKIVNKTLESYDPEINENIEK